MKAGPLEEPRDLPYRSKIHITFPDRGLHNWTCFRILLAFLSMCVRQLAASISLTSRIQSVRSSWRFHHHEYLESTCVCVYIPPGSRCV